MHRAAPGRHLARIAAHSGVSRTSIVSFMNTIFNGRITRAEVVYDYSGVWTRRSGEIVWKAVVRNADVVCRPQGVLDDILTDREVRDVIRELVVVSVADASGE